MIGRQFTYYCSAEDLREIDEMVFRPLGSSLLAAEKTNGGLRFRKVESFAPTPEDESAPWLLYLQPPKELELVLHTGAFLDTANSHLIEIGRSTSGSPRLAAQRFWYSPTTFDGRSSTDKPPEFLAWANSIFRRTKTRLLRHSYALGNHTYSAWIGKAANKALITGEISLIY